MAYVRGECQPRALVLSLKISQYLKLEVQALKINATDPIGCHYKRARGICYLFLFCLRQGSSM